MAEIQVDFDLTTDNSIEADFVLYCASSYNFEDGLTEHNGIVTLDKASDEAIGGVIIGDNIDVTEEGVISVPQATNESFGAIRIATDEEAVDKTIVDLCINPKQLIEATEDIVRLDSFSAISPVLYDNTTGVFSADFDSEPTEDSGKFLTSGVIKTALDDKQDVIADLSTIRAGASAGATAVQPGDNISLLNNDANYQENAIELIEVNGVIQSINEKTVNIPVPTQASDIGALPDTTTINDLTTNVQQNALNSGVTSGDVSLIRTALQPNDNISELNNDAGFITGINSSDVTNALGYTPYDSSNPDGYITGITSSDVTTALGYTPYNSTNPNGYQANILEGVKVNGTSQTITNKTVDITVPTDTSDLTNGAGYITGINSSDVTEALGYTPYDSSNPNGYISGITSSDVTTALGYTPYDSSNPNGYISGITSSDVTIALGYTPYDSSNPDGFITGIDSTAVTEALGYTPYDSSNPDGYISGITSSDVTTALGYTPYNSTNPDGYQANAIEVIKVNDVAQTITSKAVNIPVPTQPADIGAVPTSRTINNKALTSDITLNSSDVGALSSSTTINDLTTTAQQNALNSGATTTNIGQIATNTSDISAINEKIPVQATSSNQLADKAFVNSSIATNTANFIGTFESVSNLEGYSGTVTNNDYAFVINGVVTDNGNDWSDFNSLDAYNKALLTNFDYAWVVNGSNFDLYRFDIVAQEWDLRVSDTPKADVTLNTAYNRYKATVSGSSVTWEYEYTLNNSSFTASQWAAINSGITSGDVSLIQTALQPNDNISALTNDSGYITGITSSDVTTALGYTPYDSSNPNGYTSNVGTVTSVNNTQPDSNGNVTLVIPSTQVQADWDETDPDSKAYILNKPYIPSGVIVDQTYNSTSTNAQSGVAIAGAGFLTGITSSDVTTALGYTPYSNANPSGYQANVIETIKVNGTAQTVTSKAVDIPVPTDTSDLTNGAGYITGITSSDVTTALGYTPYNSTNPSGYQANVIETIKVNDVAQTVTSKAVNIPVPTDTSDLTNGAGFITGITSSDVTTALGYTPYSSANPDGFISGITSSDVTTALGYTPYDSLNPDGYISGITSSDVTTALGYTPYDSSNPNGYTSNEGTVTSVNNTQPVNGDVTIAIPSATSDLNNDSGFITSSALANYVTLDTDQNITGTKTYVGQKRIAFKQSGTSDKLGFTLYNSSGTEKGYLEFNPSNTVDSIPLMTLGNYASASAGLTHVGFRKYSSISGASGAYNLLAPLISDAKTPFSLTTTYTNFYLPLGFTNGSTTVTTAKSGVVDLSSLIPPSVTVDQTYSATSTNPQSGTAVAGALSDYVPTTRTINSKALSSNITLTASDVSALPDSTVIPTITDTYSSTSSDGMSGKAVASALASYELLTNVTSKGSATQPVYFDANGVAQNTTYTLAKSVPSDAVFTDTKVTQNVSTTNSTYPILLCPTANASANQGEKTSIFASGVKVNPSTSTITATTFDGNASTATKLGTADKGSATQPIYLSGGTPTACTYTLAKSVPADAVFTDTNTLVTQNVSTTNSTYPILLCPTANATANQGEKTSIFASGVKVNPSTSTITATTFSGNATSATTATKLGSSNVGSATQPIYLNAGAATACTYTLAKSVPADAVFTDTTYSVFTGANGTSAGTTGLVKQPAATDNAKFLKGDCTWATPTDTKNTAGSTDTSSKIFLVGATSQADNPQTYSHDTAFVDTSGQLNSANPAASTNSTVVATTKWVTDKGYLTSHQTIKQDGVTGATVNRYGSCSTGASTAAKTVSITTGTFNLETGAKVTVKFTNANTASTPTLNVNSKGAKNIFHNGAQITTGDNKALLAGTCDFVYDGTQWQLIGNYIDTNTTYANGTGITIGTGNAINHSNSVTAGTAGTSSATSGSTLAVPYVTYDAQGHVTATGTHTHTVTGFATTDTKNTAGSTDTSSKIFLVGATSQAANPQTYSHDTAFVDTNGRLNSAAPASDANDTTVSTTKWVKDQSYVTTNTVQTITADKTFNGVVAFENGAATGCVTLGADVAATTVTNDTRKLGRMSFHTYENNVLCAFVSTDSISGNNYVEFGGRTGDTTNTAPDTLSFTIANSHNSVNSKTSALEITKTGGADFKIQPKYNGTNLATETVFTGADGSSAGTSGLVPQPAATDNNKYLKGDGTWGEIDVSSAANKSLSNLETAGENRLHAVKGYFESGTLYTDDTLYASTFTNSSTVFDRTKVSRVSTPVISADGFAYNFANGRYVRSSSSIDCRYPFTIIVNEQKTVTNNLFRGFGLSRTGNVAYPLVFIQPAYSGWFTVGWYINGNLVTRDLAFDEKSYTSVDYILSWDGTYYKFEIRDALTGKTINSDTLNNTSSLYRTEYTGYIIFGWNYNSGQKMELTDLKRARLYSNNELIWSGSAIGMDTVENYLVAGTPTISEGVVSNFSSDNYIDTKQSLTGDTWEIDISFTTGASFNANDRILGRIYSFGLVLGLTSGGALVLWASSNGTSWDIASSTNSGTKVLSASTSYDIRVKFNGTQYLVDVSSDSGSTWTNYITVSSSSKIFSGAKIVIGTDVDGSATYYLRAGSIDLNGFQILQNSVITYQAYSEIPYIKARDGAKIADINDQNKVLQAYEFGKSGYYIINNVNKQVSLPTYELYGLASKGSNSPFVIVDYTT